MPTGSRPTGTGPTDGALTDAEATGAGPTGAGPAGSKPSRPRTRLLVADAAALLAEALAVALGGQEDLQVLEAHPTTGEDTLAAAVKLDPDVVLLDYWIPGMRAKEVVEHLCERAVGTAVVVLAWPIGADNIEAVMAAGAAGILPKQVTVAEVAEAARRAHAGERPVFGDRLRGLRGRLEGRARHDAELRRRLAKLTPREEQVVRLLAEGLSRAQIADRLGVAVGTVRSHLNHIYAKAGTSVPVDVVAMARAVDLID